MSVAPVSRRVTKSIDTIEKAKATLCSVIRDKEEPIRFALAALLARGHLLIEDIPGVGKTTLARAMAAVLGGTFRRIQFTSDLLPADITGTNIFLPQSQEFEFRKGPIFANVVLADEINRTTPRTQSALLEAMSDNQVSVDERTYDLENPFFVIATQNPVEHFGTYPLPESQMDRFLLRIRLGYPAREFERDILRERRGADPVLDLRQVIDHDELISLQDEVENIEVTDALLDYAMTLVEETRQHPSLEVGVSTRGAIAFYRVAQAHALTEGRDYCLPDDFKQLAVAALAHRVVQSSIHDSPGGAREESERIIGEIVERVPVPI